MQNQWNSLLGSLPGPIDAQRVSPDMGYVACLTAFEILQVTGPDRLTLLQGQMTCDFTQIEGKLLLGANCNLKGRTSASFYAIDGAIGSPTDSTVEGSETTHLILPAGQAPHLKSLLDKYALFANAELSIDNQELVVMGLIGEQALSITGIDSLSKNQSIEIKPEINQASCQGNVSQGNVSSAYVSRIGDSSLYLCVVDINLAQAWLTMALSNKNLSITNQDTWDQQQIASGIAHVTTDSQDLFIPQELNYDLIDGISFTKGCYKGQEIIARLHYRGTYKQRSYRFQCETDVAPKPGTPIYTTGSEQPCGHVTQSAPNADGTTELLAVIKIKALESEPLHLEQKDGPILHSLSLPYAITNTEDTN